MRRQKWPFCAAGHGGQVLLSAEARGALPDGFELRELGEHRLRGLDRPERIYQLLSTELSDSFPPLRADLEPSGLG